MQAPGHFRYDMFSQGIFVDPMPPTSRLDALAQKLHPQQSRFPLVRMGFERMTDAQRPDLAHSLGVMLLNQNQPRQAGLYLDFVLSQNHQRYSTRLHLAYAEVLLGNNERAANLLYKTIYDKPLQISTNDSLLETALIKKLHV